MASSDPLAQAIECVDVDLVRLALQLAAASSDHLQMALSIEDPRARMGICRALVLGGANPHDGAPSPLATAESRGLEAEAWGMVAAWQERSGVASLGGASTSEA